jgi:hypothetical protein
LVVGHALEPRLRSRRRSGPRLRARVLEPRSLSADGVDRHADRHGEHPNDHPEEASVQADDGPSRATELQWGVGVRVHGSLLAGSAGASDGDAFLMGANTDDEDSRLEELVDDVVVLAEPVVDEGSVPARVWTRSAGASVTRIASGICMYTWVPSSKTRTGFHGTLGPSIW